MEEQSRVTVTDRLGKDFVQFDTRVLARWSAHKSVPVRIKIQVTADTDGSVDIFPSPGSHSTVWLANDTHTMLWNRVTCAVSFSGASFKISQITVNGSFARRIGSLEARTVSRIDSTQEEVVPNFPVI